MNIICFIAGHKWKVIGHTYVLMIKIDKKQCDRCNVKDNEMTDMQVNTIPSRINILKRKYAHPVISWFLQTKEKYFPSKNPFLN